MSQYTAHTFVFTHRQTIKLGTFSSAVHEPSGFFKINFRPIRLMRICPRRSANINFFHLPLPAPKKPKKTLVQFWRWGAGGGGVQIRQWTVHNPRNISKFCHPPANRAFSHCRNVTWSERFDFVMRLIDCVVLTLKQWLTSEIQERNEIYIVLLRLWYPPICIHAI